MTHDSGFFSVIASLLPPEVITVLAKDHNIDGQLFPEEEILIVKAVEKRKREYTAGRLCAHKALSQLGINDFPVLAGKNRDPLWPHNIIGSITHCEDYCAVAAARQGRIRSIGIDIEPAEKISDEIIDMVCRSAEKNWCNQQSNDIDNYWPKVIFSIKESIYKCLYPILQRYVDFHEVQIQLNPELGVYSINLFLKEPNKFISTRNFEGRYAIFDAHIFATAILIETRPHDNKTF